MVQDSPIPDTPMLERTLLAPKNADVRSVSVLVSGCTSPRLSILAASPSCTPPAEPLGTVRDASCLDAPEFKDVCASKRLQQELKQELGELRRCPKA
jgi:hypothetical protein